MRVKLLAGALLIVALVGCELRDREGVPLNAVVVEVQANTSLSAWLDVAAKKFNQAGVKAPAGRPVFARVSFVEAGQAVSDMAAGDTPHLWIPDSDIWVDVLTRNGKTAFQGNCQSVAASPLVIAMWRPVAEALGWPGRTIGWLDISSLAADPTAWAYYSGGQFGPSLRLGHTHPGLSGSGASTLLAVVHAARNNPATVSAEMLRQPIVQASVASFESTVSWFSPTTEQLGRAMRERGVGYLGAAIVYENIALQFADGDPAIVPVYPFEGTFVATHPACINGAADAELQEAAKLFRDYLLGEDAQALAAGQGLRPVNTAVTPAAPLDPAYGVDLNQPQTVFGAPSVDAIYAAQELWQSARKPVNLVMLLDRSGSMRGDKIESVRRAAVQFVEQMGDQDRLTLIAFSSRPEVLIEYARIGDARQDAIDAINYMPASGNTSLYDAIALGTQIIEDTTSSQRTNVMVVLSDGLDTSSARTYSRQLIVDATAHNTTVFTIAYGGDADHDLMRDMASVGNGNYYQGTEANIAGIYQDMSAAFGGAAGIGR